MPPRVLRMIHHNIIHGGGNRLNMALRAMNEMHIDFGILTETKLPNEKYTHQCEGYTIYATHASRHQGGVAIFYRNSPQWTFEGITEFGPNVLRSTLVSGNLRWTIIGLYIPPSDKRGDTLHWLETATTGVTHDLIVLGDLNCNLHHPRDDRAHDISDAISLLNVSDVANHFTHPRGRWTWSHRQRGRFSKSITDYVLAQYPLTFTRWAIKTPRFSSDHRAIVAELPVQSKQRHRLYLRQRAYPIQEHNSTIIDVPSSVWFSVTSKTSRA